MSSELVFAPLPYAFIAVSGEDATRFLQGQTSCDVEALGEHEVRFGTVNTPKGRMVALFRIQRWPNGFLLRMHSSLCDGLLQHLGKYKVFFKCSLEVCEHLQAFGLVSTPPSEASELAPDHWQHFHTGRLHRLPGASGLLEYQSETPPGQVLSEHTTPWLMRATRDGLPELFASTGEHFILQHLNLHELGGVSFTKGCYTGQEIIARMKYLGKLKKRMFVLEGEFTWQDEALPEPGAQLYFDDGSKAGQLVQIHGSNALGWVAQAVCDLSLADTPRNLYLSAQAQGALRLCGD